MGNVSLAIRLWFKIKRFYKKTIYNMKRGTLFWFNNERKEAKAQDDKFCNMIFKLINKAFSGKTIEKVYNIEDVELVNDINRYFKLVENINFKNAVEFDDDLLTVHKTKRTIRLVKRNYIGFVILEKAKLFIYKTVGYSKSNKNIGCIYTIDVR